MALRKACHRHEDSFKVGLHRTIYKCHVGIQTHAHTHILELQTATNVAVSPFQGSSVQCVYITRNSNTAHSHTHFRFNHENVVCAHTQNGIQVFFCFVVAFRKAVLATQASLCHTGTPRATQAPPCHTGTPVPHRHPPCYTGTLGTGATQKLWHHACTSYNVRGYDILMQTNNQFQAMS